MARLELQGLCKGWDFPVIDRMDLTVEEGEFFVIVGPSGIGKTTLLRLVAGLEAPDAGKVLVDGRDITALPPYRRRVAMTFESYALYPHKTVAENIASPLRARKTDAATIAKRVQSVAELLRIDHLLDRKPGEVSGGQKQRTALGRTLVADPEIFLLDEPISHLDAKIRHELRQQFHTLEDLRKVATLYVTHDYAEALSLGDRIGVMGSGGLVDVGTARDLFERPANLFVAEHLGQPTINVIPARLESHADVLHLRANQGDLLLPVDPARAHLLAARNDGAVTIGLRPQFVRPADEMPAGSAQVTANVDLYEALGSTGILIADILGLRITALTSPERIFEHDTQVQLAVDTAALHYFDPRTGANLTLQTPGAGAATAMASSVASGISSRAEA
ncbi:ABC transporter ATP-binding protein [Pelagibius sp. Alg239-R121]|uniref:ABC transporter ATP-binding protein n=1 Tax=Pelagibius sp. Alg239-R121 TaxID=2993448 RepID=UPI0024A667CE|nr:ABC transporter ATP-binding protein [Pelagibius sp. Alg239-R121]